MSRFYPLLNVPDDWVLEIIKKPIRHFYFRVVPAHKKIVISCPVAADNRSVDQAIQSKTDWIHRQVHQARSLPVKPVFSYVTGEIHLYRGTPCVLLVKPTQSRQRVRVSGENELVMYVRSGIGPEKRKALLQDWYRDCLQRIAGRMCDHWEPVVGVTVNQVRVRKMKTRWGSCNINAARIWLNLDLIRLSSQYLEYVLVHEMVHLLERCHNQRFYAHMDRLMPGWSFLKKSLDQAYINVFSGSGQM